MRLPFCHYFLTLAISLGLAACQTSPRHSLRVAAAASALPYLDSLDQLFTQQTGVPVELITASSGALAAQIQQGAPFHLYFAADMDYPQRLADRGLTIGLPKEWGRGKLVLWSLSPLTDSLSLAQLLNGRRLAMANPSLAPYGKASQEFLTSQGWWRSLQGQLVVGENVGQVGHFIVSGAVPLGLVALSMATAYPKPSYWQEVPASLYAPLRQGVVMVSQKEMHPRADDFLQLVFSDKGQQLLGSFGFDIPLRD